MTTFAEARQFLLDHREDYAGAYAGFRWPEPAAPEPARPPRSATT